MGIFDEGYQQATIDAARQPIDKPTAGIVDLSRTNEDY
jgi:hypothetical protein